MEKPYEMVDHPTHYNKYSVEVIDMFRKIYGDEATALWCEMTALKYRLRMGEKPENDIQQDLKKEEWYLNKKEEIKRDIVRDFEDKMKQKEEDIERAVKNLGSCTKPILFD